MTRRALQLGGKTLAIRQNWPSRSKAASGPSRLSQCWDGVLMVERTRGSRETGGPHGPMSARPSRFGHRPASVGTAWSTLYPFWFWRLRLDLRCYSRELFWKESCAFRALERTWIAPRSMEQRISLVTLGVTDFVIEGVYADDLGADALASARGRFPYGL